MTVWEKKFVRPDGVQGTYGIVDKRDFGLIIPVSGKVIYLIHLYRYAVNNMSWEFPSGHVDRGESIVASARRELTEETGLKAKAMTRLGHLWLACGHHTQGYVVFLGEGCEKVSQFDAGEVDHVKGFSLSQIQRMIRSGKIKDSQTVAAIQLYLLRTKRT